MKLLILSTGGSGTLYTRCLLHDTFGLNVGHMKLRADGMIGPQLIPDQHWMHMGKGKRHPLRTDVEWTDIWHQIRHPLKTMASARWWRDREKQWFWPIFEKEFGIKLMPGHFRQDKINNLAIYWLYANKMAQARAKVSYRVEDLSRGGSVWRKLVKRLGVPYSPPAAVGTNVHHRAKHIFTWEQIDEPLRSRVQEYAREMGYKV